MCPEQNSVPLPLLLKESSIISIIISTGFPTALLLTILLLGHLVWLAACKSNLLPSTGWCRVWLDGCSAGSHFYEFLQRQIPLWRRSPVPAFRQTSESDVESNVTWEKPWGAPGPKRLRVAGGSRRSWWPCSCQGDAGHIGCQPGHMVIPPWCASREAGLQGTKVVKNLSPLAAGREVGFKIVTPARRVQTLHEVLPPGRSCGAQQSPTRLDGCSSVKEQCCWLALLLGFYRWPPYPIAKQHSSQDFLLPCYSGAFHYSPCRTLTSLNLSRFLQFISQTPRYTLILSFSIFAYPPWFEWYLNRGLLLKARTDLHVWLHQELLMKIPTSMGE